MREEMLEDLILGHIAKELKDEIKISRQVNLAKTIMQALRIHGVVGQSEQSARKSCHHACSPSDYYKGGKCDKMGCYGG